MYVCMYVCVHVCIDVCIPAIALDPNFTTGPEPNFSDSAALVASYVDNIPTFNAIARHTIGPVPRKRLKNPSFFITLLYEYMYMCE